MKPNESAAALSAATISECGTYRYTLHRRIPCPLRWVRPCLFIMLNPSIADATIDDPTIRRCIGFAKAWSCTELTVVNLFALRATDPKALAAHPVTCTSSRTIRSKVLPGIRCEGAGLTLDRLRCPGLNHGMRCRPHHRLHVATLVALGRRHVARQHADRPQADRSLTAVAS